MFARRFANGSIRTHHGGFLRSYSASASSSSGSSLQLYGFKMSQPVRAILMLLQNNNINYEFMVCDALKGDNRKPEFLKLNPAGLVPCIVDDGFVLGESCAILQHLAETRQLYDWYPQDPQLRAKTNFWLHWHHSNTRQSTKGVLHWHLFSKLKGAEENLKKGKALFARTLKFLEQQLGQKDEGFLVYDKPTIADLIVLAELDQQLPGAFNLISFEPYPNISAWMKRVQSSVTSYDEIFQPVTEAAQAFKE